MQILTYLIVRQNEATKSGQRNTFNRHRSQVREARAPDCFSENVVLETQFDRFEILRTIGQG